jgi:alanyl-tRNA synthetase
MDGLMAVFDAHRHDLAPIYGPFPPYPSFRQIIEIEHERWLKTDVTSKKQLEKLTKAYARGWLGGGGGGGA